MVLKSFRLCEYDIFTGRLRQKRRGNKNIKNAVGLRQKKLNAFCCLITEGEQKKLKNEVTEVTPQCYLMQCNGKLFGKLKGLRLQIQYYCFFQKSDNFFFELFLHQRLVRAVGERKTPTAACFFLVNTCKDENHLSVLYILPSISYNSG